MSRWPDELVVPVIGPLEDVLGAAEYAHKRWGPLEDISQPLPLGLHFLEEMLPLCVGLLAVGDVGDRPVEAREASLAALTRKIRPAFGEHPPD